MLYANEIVYLPFGLSPQHVGRIYKFLILIVWWNTAVFNEKSSTNF